MYYVDNVEKNEKKSFSLDQIKTRLAKVKDKNKKNETLNATNALK